MRATDVLRQVLDLLDEIEGPQDIKSNSIEADVHVHQNGDTDNRFKQVLAMLDADSFGTLANSPNEVVAPIEAVTTDAGGNDMHSPKDPHNIRVKDPRM